MPSQVARRNRLGSQLWGVPTPQARSSGRCTDKPRVSITIDHLGVGTSLSTQSLIQQTYNTAPTVHFTVFVMCTDKTDCCRGALQEARNIYQLNPKLVRLGVHTLPMMGDSQACELEQFHNTALLHSGLSKIMGSKYISLSYHGSSAGSSTDKVIPCYLEKYIRYARTIKEDTGGEYEALFIPIVYDSSSIERAKAIIERNWKQCRTTTFFFHSHQLVGPTQQSCLFDLVVNGIRRGEYESFPFPR